MLKVKKSRSEEIILWTILKNANKNSCNPLVMFQDQMTVISFYLSDDLDHNSLSSCWVAQSKEEIIATTDIR